MATANTAMTPEAARRRLVDRLHPAIRDFIRAVHVLSAAVKARDLDAIERAMREVERREVEYLKEWER